METQQVVINGKFSSSDLQLTNSFKRKRHHRSIIWSKEWNK
ncbi:unnamed protein product [Brassica rapa subsp. narinosa]